MAIETYPVTSPTPAENVQLAHKHNTLVSDLESGAELRRMQVRFAKRNVNLHYPILLTTERDTLQNFFTKRRGRTDPFWFVDPASRVWVDQYVGRGGPLPVLGAVADDGGVMTNQTVQANCNVNNGMTLLPASPANNDAYYIGATDQFTKVTFAFSQLGVGVWTGIWEYYNTTTGLWTDLTANIVSDGTTCFKSGTATKYTVKPLNGFTFQYTPPLTISTTSSGRPWNARAINRFLSSSPIIDQRIFADLTFTVPTNWGIYNLYDASTSNPDINAYWIRMRMTGFTSMLTQPLGCGVTVSSKTYDLRGVSTASIAIYINGTLKAGSGADYTAVFGGGGAGADRITFTAYPATGALITSDFTGRLRLKTRFTEDTLSEEHIGKDFLKMDVALTEVQW